MSNQTRTGEGGGAKWTPEPWKAGTPYQHSDIANLLIPIVSDATADTVALVVGGEDDAATHADSARIVSCVNAMQGIDDPAALRKCFDDLRDFALAMCSRHAKVAQRLGGERCVAISRNANDCDLVNFVVGSDGLPVFTNELRAALQSAKSQSGGAL